MFREVSPYIDLMKTSKCISIITLVWDKYQFSNRLYLFSFHFDGSTDHSGQIGLRANIGQTKNLQTNTIIL